MINCLAESDVKEMANVILADSDDRLSGIPEVMCAPFYEEAQRLEVELLSLYRVIAVIVKKEDDLDKISKWWEMMVSVCDDFAERLGKLSKAHPYCGASAYFDRLEELKRKCQRLQMMHSLA